MVQRTVSRLQNGIEICWSTNKRLVLIMVWSSSCCYVDTHLSDNRYIRSTIYETSWSISYSGMVSVCLQYGTGYPVDIHGRGSKYFQGWLIIFIESFVPQLAVGIYRARYNLLCQPMVASNDENEMKIANVLWYYFFSKAIEFLDTILMVVRKRFTQITFLHVFHHSTMLIIWWIVMSWIPVCILNICINWSVNDFPLWF